jgi:prolyl-tRNA synthetase
MVGGLIMAHGDDHGLRLPPRLAPTQVVVLLVRDGDGAGEAAERLTADLVSRGVRAELDPRTDVSFGRRATDWELKGVPVRIEVGPRDLANGEVTIVRRDTTDKSQAKVADVADEVPMLLERIQDELLASATALRESRTVDTTGIEDAREAAVEGFARVPWDVLGVDGEAALASSAVTVRCLQREDGSIPERADEPGLVALVARSY